MTDKKPDVLLVGPSEPASRLRDAIFAAGRREAPLVVIGTSGSTDYLRDGTGGKRFWPVTISAPGESCDGIHDEEAPQIYLCTRCFPNVDARGDLASRQDEDDDEVRWDEPEEME